MRKREAHSSEAQIARARRQLIAVGVVCVAVVVIMVWAFNIRSTFSRNKKAYTSTIPTDELRNTYQEVNEKWAELRSTLTP